MSEWNSREFNVSIYNFLFGGVIKLLKKNNEIRNFFLLGEFVYSTLMLCCFWSCDRMTFVTWPERMKSLRSKVRPIQYMLGIKWKYRLVKDHELVDHDGIM